MSSVKDIQKEENEQRLQKAKNKVIAQTVNTENSCL